MNDQLGYACFAKYTDSNPINHPETISKMQRSVVNFLNGHNMQTAGIWTNESLDGTGTYSYATDAHYMGTKSLKMVKTNQTGWMTARQDVTLPKGQAYTFSAFFQTLADTVAQLRVTYKNSYGDEVAVDSLPQCCKGEWERMSVSFSLPADSASDSATVRLMAGGGAGTVWFDCAQLEAGEVANRYNMLTNGDFTFNCGAHPTGWSKNSSNTNEDMVYADCTGTKPEGLSANTMRLYGTGRTKYAGIYQDIPISGSKGDVFVAGGWSLNFSKPRKGEDFRYNIRVAFLKAGTSSTRVNTSSIDGARNGRIGSLLPARWLHRAIIHPFASTWTTSATSTMLNLAACSCTRKNSVKRMCMTAGAMYFPRRMQAACRMVQPMMRSTIS